MLTRFELLHIVLKYPNVAVKPKIGTSQTH